MTFTPTDGMTLDQMQQEFRDLGQQMSAISVRRECLLKCIGKLKADALAKANLGPLTPQELSALKAALEGTP